MNNCCCCCAAGDAGLSKNGEGEPRVGLGAASDWRRSSRSHASADFAGGARGLCARGAIAAWASSSWIVDRSG